LNIKLLYFARLREALGIAAEHVTLPAEVETVAALTEWLRARGGGWAHELAPGRAYRVAVDQDMADAQSPLHDGAEVAFFPPVTGG
jgi:molybdopterin synthase sulfur carrier subunit